MPFGKDKTPARSPLQRLNDQRHKVALAGLAAGAAVAAVFRRKKSGGEAEFGAPTAAAEPLEPVATQAPTDAGAPAQAETPTAVAEPAAVSGQPVVAEPPATTPAEPSPVEPPATTISDPATGELSAEEASILAILAQSGRADDDRTAIAVATSLERGTDDVATVLRKLGAEGVVSDEKQTADGDEIWAVTERGVRRLGAQH